MNGANQSLPKSERCLDIYHMKTDLELVRPGHNVKFNYSNSLADGMLGPSSSFSSYLHAPASGPLHCSTCLQTTPIINQDCRYYLGPTRHQNRKRVPLLRLCPQLVKLEKKVIRSIFTGYDEQKKGSRCVDPTTNKAYVSPL